MTTVDFTIDTHDGSDFEPQLIEYLRENWDDWCDEIRVDVSLLDAIPVCVFVEVDGYKVWAKLPRGGNRQTVVESDDWQWFANYQLEWQLAWPLSNPHRNEVTHGN